MRNRIVLCCLLLLAVITGCTQQRCPGFKTVKPIEAVIKNYNANATRLPRIWLRVDLTAVIREKPSDLIGLPWTFSNGIIMIRKQDNRFAIPDFKLILKEAGKTVAQVGTSSNDRVYYMWQTLSNKIPSYFGELKYAGAPNVNKLPIDPIQLMSILCINELPADLTRAPFVTQRISSKPCAYVLTYIDRQPVTNKFIARREIYFQRAVTVNPDGNEVELPCRPFMVKIFDQKGFEVFTAKMSKYKPITLEDVDDENQPYPVMPTNIEMKCNITGTWLKLNIKHLTTGEEFDSDAYDFWDIMPAKAKANLKKVDQNIKRSSK